MHFWNDLILSLSVSLLWSLTKEISERFNFALPSMLPLSYHEASRMFQSTVAAAAMTKVLIVICIDGIDNILESKYVSRIIQSVLFFFEKF